VCGKLANEAEDRTGPSHVQHRACRYKLTGYDAAHVYRLAGNGCRNSVKQGSKPGSCRCTAIPSYLGSCCFEEIIFTIDNLGGFETCLFDAFFPYLFCAYGAREAVEQKTCLRICPARSRGEKINQIKHIFPDRLSARLYPIAAGENPLIVQLLFSHRGFFACHQSREESLKTL
jgi:hypothetical protein